MKKMNRKALAVVCCTGLLAVAGASMAMAQSQTILAGGVNTEATGGPGAQDVLQERYQIWGPVLSVNENSITIDNKSGVSYAGEIVLNISEEQSKVLGAVDGLPLQLSDIRVGDVIYAYIGNAMTMSLPPQTAAEMIIAKIPADYKVPELVTVKDMVWHENGDWTLTAANGSTYEIPGECPIVPYLTRQMVTLADVTESSQLLLWSDAEGNGQKIVLFAAEPVME